MEGLRTKAAMDKENSYKNDDLSVRILHMQDQIQELLMEARQARQPKQEKNNLSSKCFGVHDRQGTCKSNQ